MDVQDTTSEKQIYVSGMETVKFYITSALIWMGFISLSVLCLFCF